jgi:hypothetical protein
MTAVRRMGRAMCACTTGVSWYLMMGTRRLLGRAAESIAGRPRLVSWLSRWLGWVGIGWDDKVRTPTVCILVAACGYL